MTVCTEMKKLRKMLDDKAIEWEDHSDDYSFDGHEMWICRTWFEYCNYKVSVINGYGTYGGYSTYLHRNFGKLEMMFGGNEPIGFLNAQDIIEFLSKQFGGVL